MFVNLKFYYDNNVILLYLLILEWYFKIVLKQENKDKSFIGI